MQTRTLGSELQRARKAKRLRQDDVAQKLKCDRRRISALERDRAQPDESERRELASCLGISRALLDSLCLPELPPLGKTPEAYWTRKPRYLPVGDRPPWKRLLALFQACRRIYETLWKQLNMREDRGWLRRFFIKAQQDSKHESLGWMRLVVDGLTTNWLSPQWCGYRNLPIIDPVTYQIVGDCRVPCLLREGPYPAVIFVQPTIHTRTGGPLRPDGLVGVRVNGGMLWCATEFDGEGYEKSENTKAAHLRMPVVRFSVEEIWKDDFAELYWRRVHAAVGISG